MLVNGLRIMNGHKNRTLHKRYLQMMENFSQMKDNNAMLTFHLQSAPTAKSASVCI